MLNGANESEKNAVPSTSFMEFLGYTLDTIKITTQTSARGLCFAHMAEAITATLYLYGPDLCYVREHCPGPNIAKH